MSAAAKVITVSSIRSYPSGNALNEEKGKNRKTPS